MVLTSVTLFLSLVAISFGDLSDVGLTTPEIIENHGYPAETHKVTTEDGYILSLHRIPHGADADETTKKPAVFLMHGLTASSADFVNMGPGRSLSYVLADEGYDVWLGNARGTQYSRHHVSLDVVENAAQFFNYSFHEIGYYDVAASIDYILNASDTKALHFVGHSQGCAAFLVLASTRPEYNSKVKSSALMAPAAFQEHSAGFAKKLSHFVEQLESIFLRYKTYEVPFLDQIRSILQSTCVRPEYTELCVAIFSAMSGSISNGEIDAEAIPVIASNSPSNTAIKQLTHLGQLVKYVSFKWFNYGPKRNIDFYGTATPPDYNLSKILVAVAVFYSKDDDFVAYPDVQTLVDHLSSVVEHYKVPFPTFNHVDFLFAKHAKTLVYNKVLGILKK